MVEVTRPAVPGRVLLLDVTEPRVGLLREVERGVWAPVGRGFRVVAEEVFGRR